jgi:hypothetical protein
MQTSGVVAIWDLNMLPVDYLSGALVQSAQLQLLQAAEKNKQARKAAELAKNVAARDDEMEHQVENSEELKEVHEEGRQSQEKKKDNSRHPGDESDDEKSSDGLDLTA